MKRLNVIALLLMLPCWCIRSRVKRLVPSVDYVFNNKKTVCFVSYGYKQLPKPVNRQDCLLISFVCRQRCRRYLVSCIYAFLLLKPGTDPTTPQDYIRFSCLRLVYMCVVGGKNPRAYRLVGVFLRPQPTRMSGLCSHYSSENCSQISSINLNIILKY